MTGKLLFHPPQESPVPDPERLADLLQASGLIAQPIAGRNHAYYAGDRFLQLITFLGCSPFVHTEPQSEDDEDFCHVIISGPYRQPRFRQGRNTRPPRCPACLKTLSNWETLLPDSSSNSRASCPECGNEISFQQLDWRKNAGFGSLFIEVCSIFPGEAIPSTELIKLLAGDGDDWGYFYLQE